MSVPIRSMQLHACIPVISKTRIRVLSLAIPWHQSAPRHELKDRPSDLASNGARQSSRGIEPGRLLFPVPSPAVAFRSPFSSSPALPPPPPPRLQIILQRQPGRATATVMRLKGRRRCGIGASLPGRRGLGSLHAPVRLVFVPTTPATAGGAALLHSTATPPPLPPAAADASLLSRHDHLWALTCVAAVCKGRRCHWWVPRWKRGQAAAKRVQSQDRALCTHRRRAWNA